MGTVIVTGSASGIGAAVRARLEADGDRVVGIDLRDAEILADLSNPEGRGAALASALEATGGAIDRAVFSAGVAGSCGDNALIASLNYFGAIDLADGLFDALKRGTDPAAVLLCSNSARFAPVDDHPYVHALLDHDEKLARELVVKEHHFIAYGGSKHALSRALRRRAMTWGEAGVRLNGIAPGPVATPLLQGTLDDPESRAGFEAMPMPLGRHGTPEEIADFIAIMLGPKAAFMHGSVVYLDGGNDAAMFPERF